MSYLAKNPSAWAPDQPDDGPPAPAPVRLSVKYWRGMVLWSLDEIYSGENLAGGTEDTETEATEAGEAAAQRLGCTRVHDGWTLEPERGYLP